MQVHGFVVDFSHLSYLFTSSTSSASSLSELIILSAWDAEIRSEGLNLIKPWMTGRRGFRLCSWIRSSNFCSSFDLGGFSSTNRFTYQFFKHNLKDFGNRHQSLEDRLTQRRISSGLQSHVDPFLLPFYW